MPTTSATVDWSQSISRICWKIMQKEVFVIFLNWSVLCQIYHGTCLFHVYLLIWMLLCLQQHPENVVQWQSILGIALFRFWLLHQHPTPTKHLPLSWSLQTRLCSITKVIWTSLSISSRYIVCFIDYINLVETIEYLCVINNPSPKCESAHFFNDFMETGVY